MLPTLLSMGAASQALPAAEVTRASSPMASINSDATVDDTSQLNAQSSSSTPPTSIGDSVSVSSTSPTAAAPAPAAAGEDSGRRSIRSRANVPTYNVKILTGTAIHVPKKYVKEGDITVDLEKTRRRTIQHVEKKSRRARNSTDSLPKDNQELEAGGIASVDLPWYQTKKKRSKSEFGLHNNEIGFHTTPLGFRTSVRPVNPCPVNWPVEYPVQPAIQPAVHPTLLSTVQPIVEPAVEPALEPAVVHSIEPSVEPSAEPILAPSPMKTPPKTTQKASQKSIQKSTNKSLPKKTKNTPQKAAPKTIKQAEPERRKSTRAVEERPQTFTEKLSVLGKRKLQDVRDIRLTRAQRELKRLADTDEFAKIDTQPIVHEVWSNGKLVVPERANKKKRVEESAPKEVPQVIEPVVEKKAPGKRQKIWLNKGLYAGQENMDWVQSVTPKSKDATALYGIAPYRPTGILPMPMWHGQKLLADGRDFKLPFDVCAPLPPGQPKPDEWRKTSSNRFIGDAGALWKKSTLFDSFSSKCICNPQDGCDVDCQNRIMLYECDDENCGAGRENCTNRAFADLQERRRAGGKYRIGVEVIKTADRGYGVRSNRCFDANQIIVEYTGEIITEDECDRRMNEDYKDNDCYYLMSFDQNMIIDATKGSIARFVNHSCKPNSRMVKWIVGGKPRMALFAGDNPIMSGDELTYDYNFDPFSAKNVQECRCGSDNCRGVLGPKPKDQKPLKVAIKATVKAGKRKLKELLAGEQDTEPASPKKRKIKEAKGLKRAASSATLSVANGAKSLKRSVSVSMLNVHQAVSSKLTQTDKPSRARGLRQSKLSSMSLDLMMDDEPAGNSLTKKDSVPKNVVRSMRGGRVASESTIRLVSDAAAAIE